MKNIRDLEIHLVHGCNFRCEGCSHYSNQGHKGRLSLEEADRSMRMWSARVRPGKISLLGGEPTIHPQLPEFFELARKHWPETHLQLVTNGTFLHRHPRLPHVLQQDTNTSVVLSIHHGAPEYHETLRPVVSMLQQWVREHGVRVLRRESFKNWTRRYKGFGAEMEPYDDRQPRQSWEKCPAKHAAQLFEGKIWKCGPLAYLQLQHSKYQLSEKWTPYLQYQPLDSGCTDEELEAFFAREEESFCGMCPANPERFNLPLPTPGKPPAATPPAIVPSASRVVPEPLLEVSPPTIRPPLRSGTRPLNLPLAASERGGWKPYPLFRGSSTQMRDLSCHASVLSPGKMPHRPHRHLEEEILIMLSGEADLIILDHMAPWNPKKYRMRPGAFVYYPAYQPHTLRNPGPENATYMMFKWRAEDGVAGTPQFPEKRFVRYGGLPPGNGRSGFQSRCVFEVATQHLRKLHCHVTTLQPGCGYRPHADPYDVAIIVLEGMVRTLGREVGAHGVVFCAAGEAHGMKNVGVVPAKYLVFEFHGHGRERNTAAGKMVGSAIARG
jgi:mannose-6-phosphate isomerase-like protein (cupin superfamily)